jgi:hypothetical protein
MSKLSDGQPITYDYLSGLEEDIAKLTRAVNKLGQNIDENNNGPVLKIRGGSGSGLKGAKNVTVFTDRISVLETDNAVVEGEVKFNGVSFEGQPVVVATLLNSNKKDDDQSPPYAVITIGNINKNGFDYRIQMIRGTKTNKRTLLVNYIAVGKTSTN